MTETTEAMQQARHELQQLTADDPAASANMVRYLSALSLLVTGHRGRDLEPPEPIFLAGFQMDTSENMIVRKTAMLTGVQHVFLAFDVDDATAAPVGLGVFRTEGELEVCYSRCRLWSPANDGRAVIVPTHTGDAIDGHFVFRRGRPLVRVATPPAADLEAGFRRGERRLTQLAHSPELRDATNGAVRNVITNVRRGEITVEMRRLAA